MKIRGKSVQDKFPAWADWIKANDDNCATILDGWTDHDVMEAYMTVGPALRIDEPSTLESAEPKGRSRKRTRTAEAEPSHNSEKRRSIFISDSSVRSSLLVSSSFSLRPKEDLMLD
jgi:hypothetical protein